MIESISNFLSKDNIYNSVITIIAILSILYAFYTKIKYLCLKKAAEKVAEVEEREELTGKEKFALVILWINEELPTIFKSSLFKTSIQKLVQLAYDNAFSYAKNYIKRKTGMDVSTLLTNISNTSQETSKDTNSDDSTDN